MTKFHPAGERVYLANLFLASGTERIKDRLEDVYVSNLLPLMARDFKEGTERDLFKEVMWPIQGQEKTIAEVIESMSEEDASIIAKKIFELYRLINKNQL